MNEKTRAVLRRLGPAGATILLRALVSDERCTGFADGLGEDVYLLEALGLAKITFSPVRVTLTPLGATLKEHLSALIRDKEPFGQEVERAVLALMDEYHP